MFGCKFNVYCCSHCFVGVLCMVFVYFEVYVLRGFFSSFAIISLGLRGLFVLFVLPFDVLRFLVFFVSSSRCCPLVCSLWLWHFLVKLTYMYITNHSFEFIN